MKNFFKLQFHEENNTGWQCFFTNNLLLSKKKKKHLPSLFLYFQAKFCLPTKLFLYNNKILIRLIYKTEIRLK